MNKFDWGMVGIVTILFLLNMAEKDYLAFYNPMDAIPKESVLAKVLDGNTDGCITTPNQTHIVSVDQIKQLRTAKTVREQLNILGNAFCVTSANTARFITETGRDIEINLNKGLDHDFSKPSPNTNGMQHRLPISREPKDSGKQKAQ